MNRIDLDSHATTRLDPRVRAVMDPWWSGPGGNAASLQHATGRRARDAVEEARHQIACGLGCDPRELIFTSGATESNNLALRGLASGLSLDAQLITSAAEHRAVLDPLRRLRSEGRAVSIVPIEPDGSVDPDVVEAACTPRAALVSIMLANNEVGAINDLARIGDATRPRGLLVHCDASQAVGRLPVDLRELPVDLLSLTAHKLHGPQGIGALYVRRSGARIPLRPLMDGGAHEQGLRSGTLPVALIVGFGEAVRLAASFVGAEAERLALLRDRLWRRLQSIPDIRWNGPQVDRRLAGNLNVSFADVDGEALLVRLDQLGLDVSSGAACSSSDPEPSHVLRAMGVSDPLARASLRFGLSRFTTEDEIDRAGAIVSDAVAFLREVRQSAGPQTSAVTGLLVSDDGHFR